MPSDKSQAPAGQTLRFIAALALSALTALAALPVAGCAQARAERRIVEQLPDHTPEAQIESWHRLAEERLVSNDDAFHGLLLLADGEDPADAYPQRLEILKERGWLSPSFDQPPDAAVTRGVLAQGLTRILGIQGGLTMRLIGPHPRYALRELVYERLYPPSATRQTFTGTEYLAVIARAEDYRARQALLERENADSDRTNQDRTATPPPDPRDL